MNLWESLAVLALILAVGAKLYTAWKGKSGPASASQRANLDNSESNTIESIASDVDLAEGDTKPIEIWDEAYLILIALFVCGPLGLILLWKTDKWDSSTKMKLTIGYVALVAVVVFAALRLSTP